MQIELTEWEIKFISEALVKYPSVVSAWEKDDFKALRLKIDNMSSTASRDAADKGHECEYSKECRLLRWVIREGLNPHDEAELFIRAEKEMPIGDET